MKLIYIDPQSGQNLALYDYNLLTNIDADITYCCSVIYDAPVIDGVQYKYYFRYNNLKNNFFKAVSYVYSLLLVLLLIVRQKPDVIHIQWWRLWIVDYVFLRLAKLFCKNVVYTAHNVVPHDSGETMNRKCQLYYDKVDKIIVHVQCTKEELREQFNVHENKIFVIPHGILNTLLDEIAVKKIMSEFQEIYNLRGKIVVSSVGHQSKYKGTDIILEAYQNSRLLRESNKMVFIIAGKGSIARREMMASYKNLVIYDQFLSSEALDAIYNISDVILLPYRKISQSGVLLTAIAKEIPYVATDVGGLLEPMNIAPVGWRLEDCSYGGLSELLEYLEHNIDEISDKQNNKQAWNAIKEYYDWGAIGAKTIECYKL